MNTFIHDNVLAFDKWSEITENNAKYNNNLTMSYFGKSQRFSAKAYISPAGCSLKSFAKGASRNTNEITQPFSTTLKGSISTSRSISRLSKHTDRTVDETITKRSKENMHEVEPEACMDEIYTRMVKLMQRSLKEIRTENCTKQTYLLQKDQEHQKKLDDCIEDKANATILNGDMEVKMLRTPSGKKIGPGSYNSQEQPNKSRKSYNIMGLMQEVQRERSNSAKRRSLSRKRDSEPQNTSSLKKSFTSGTENKKPKLQVNVRKVSPGKVSMFQLVQATCPYVEIDSEKNSILALDASHELLLTRQQAFGESKKAIEKYRKLVEESQSMLNRTGDITSFQQEDLANLDTNAGSQKGVRKGYK